MAKLLRAKPLEAPFVANSFALNGLALNIRSQKLDDFGLAIYDFRSQIDKGMTHGDNGSHG